MTKKTKIFDQKQLAFWYVSPALLIMGLVVLYPFLYNLVISFSNMNLSHFHDWRLKGWSNYLLVLREKSFWYFLFKTVLWTVVNLILDKFFSFQISWLSTEWGTFAACLITNIWLGFPFMMIIALGGLQSIPNELYEAAEIDGAGSWHRFRNITVPLLKPIMVPAITLGVIWTFNNFNVVWLVSNGGEPSDTTHILVSWVYKSAFTYFRMGYAAAFSMIIFAILLIFSWNFIRRTKG